MMTEIKRIVLVVFAGLIAFIFVFAMLQTLWDYKKKAQSLEKKVSKINKRYERLNRSFQNRIEQLDNLQDKYNETVARYEEKIFGMDGTIDHLKKERNELESRLGRKEVYHRPTPDEVEDIIRRSDIDEREWSEDYDCSEFSYDTVSYLRRRGIFGCTVEINFENGDGHMLVAVNTTEGVKYIESESGVVFEEMEVGDDYCNIVGWECDWGDEISKISSCFGILKR